MGKWWVSTPFYMYWPLLGPIALKRSHGNQWKLIVQYRGKEVYLCGAKPSMIKTKADIIKLVKNTCLDAIINEGRPRRSDWLTYPHKGFPILRNVDLVFERSVSEYEKEAWGVDVWARWNKRRKGYQIVVQRDYWVIRSLGYLRRSDYWALKKWKISAEELLATYGVKVYPPGETPGRKELEREYRRAMVEDEGYGQLAIEYAEDGTLEEELKEAMLDGDRERVQWLLNSPADAREMGVSEDIIRWAFDEDEEEDEEKEPYWRRKTREEE